MYNNFSLVFWTVTQIFVMSLLFLLLTLLLVIQMLRYWLHYVCLTKESVRTLFPLSGLHCSTLLGLALLFSQFAFDDSVLKSFTLALDIFWSLYIMNLNWIMLYPLLAGWPLTATRSNGPIAYNWSNFPVQVSEMYFLSLSKSKRKHIII